MMAQLAGIGKNNMKDIAIILIEPQLGENIGAVARVMLNFSLTDLRIVSPRDPWPNESAKAMAVKASFIIDRARIFNNFVEAVGDLEYLYVTTARERDLNKPSISSCELSNDITMLVNSGVAKIGIIFGPERSGVDNRIISLSHKILSIPVGDEFTSLNLAMAAGIICYELSRVKNQITERDPGKYATQKDIQNLLTRLELLLEQTNFYQVPEKRESMKNNVNCIFQRIEKFTYTEVQTLIGIFVSLYNYKKNKD